ncbi:MAG: hypothetical protein NTU67_11730 [Gemmatimonadetes bacterium]|nr:hypothetical protein [Gemmatimonadota bacterium]
MPEPVASVFNDAYIAEQYEAWRRDPNSVDASWRQFFALPSSSEAVPPPALRILTRSAAPLVRRAT